MSIVIDGRYVGKKFVEITHGPSGAKVVTDAPKDNLGEGSAFSPTDLVAGALGACMLTIMANVCARSGWDLTGATFRVVKNMISSPLRRIGSLPLEFHLPSSLSAEARAALEDAAAKCPVHFSLHPDVEVVVSYCYDLPQ